MATLNQILYHYLTKLMEEVNGCIKSAMYLFEWSNIPINFLWTKWHSWVIDWIAFEKPWSQFWQTCVSAKNCELIKQSHPYPRWWNHALGQHMSSLTSLAVYQTVTQFKSGNVPNFHDFFWLTTVNLALINTLISETRILPLYSESMICYLPENSWLWTWLNMESSSVEGSRPSG